MATNSTLAKPSRLSRFRDGCESHSTRSRQLDSGHCHVLQLTVIYTCLCGRDKTHITCTSERCVIASCFFSKLFSMQTRQANARQRGVTMLVRKFQTMSMGHKFTSCLQRLGNQRTQHRQLTHGPHTVSLPFSQQTVVETPDANPVYSNSRLHDVR